MWHHKLLIATFAIKESLICIQSLLLNPSRVIDPDSIWQLLFPEPAGIDPSQNIDGKKLEESQLEDEGDLLTDIMPVWDELTGQLIIPSIFVFCVSSSSVWEKSSLLALRCYNSSDCIMALCSQIREGVRWLQVDREIGRIWGFGDEHQWVIFNKCETEMHFTYVHMLWLGHYSFAIVQSVTVSFLQAWAEDSIEMLQNNTSAFKFSFLHFRKWSIMEKLRYFDWQTLPCFSFPFARTILWRTHLQIF